MPTNLSELLREEYRLRRERNPAFSLRAFARWLDISPAQLSQLISGKRRVTLKMGYKIAERLDLSPAERLQYLQASMNWLDEQPPAPRALPEDQFRLIADWCHFAILSLTRLPKADPDPRWIARRLGITPAQASEASERLVRLGLLETKPRFRQIGDPLQVSSPAPSAAIRTYHKQKLALAADRLDTVPMERREFQAHTMSVNVRKLPLARKLISEALDRISAALETGAPGDVYTLAVQLFPLTQESGENKP